MSYRDVKYLEYIFLQQLKQYLFQKIHISVEKCNVSTFFILVIFCINSSLMSYRDVKYLEYILLQKLKPYVVNFLGLVPWIFNLSVMVHLNYTLNVPFVHF